MANNCFYMVKVVAPSKDKIDEFLSILKYEHPKGLYMCRMFSCYENREAAVRDDGKWEAVFSGDCAWSLHTCISNNGYWHDIMDSAENGTNHYFCKETIESYKNGSVLHIGQVCKLLDITTEWWSEEEGCEFQEHLVVTPESGDNYEVECVDWQPENVKLDEDGNEVLDNNGNEVVEPASGGFENYGEWSI